MGKITNPFFITPMTTIEAFLQALDEPDIKTKYLDSTVRTWRSRVNRDLLSLDFMVAFLMENGYHPQQTMQWSKLENTGDTTGITKVTDLWAHEHEQMVKGKSELGTKLFEVRKEMGAALLAKWYNWCKAEYSIEFPDKKLRLTEAVFSQMTYGRYISKDNILFALKALKEGKRMLQEFEEHVKRELQNI
ncbi:MAG: hypothetical protein JWO06_2414 [Bacteroidota bacterium]|nr:hypothetical protein [Bacteroidota bacterium]